MTNLKTSSTPNTQTSEKSSTSKCCFLKGFVYIYIILVTTATLWLVANMSPIKMNLSNDDIPLLEPTPVDNNITKTEVHENSADTLDLLLKKTINNIQDNQAITKPHNKKETASFLPKPITCNYATLDTLLILQNIKDRIVNSRDITDQLTLLKDSGSFDNEKLMQLDKLTKSNVTIRDLITKVLNKSAFKQAMEQTSNNVATEEPKNYWDKILHFLKQFFNITKKPQNTENTHNIDYKTTLLTELLINNQIYAANIISHHKGSNLSEDFKAELQILSDAYMLCDEIIGDTIKEKNE